MNDVLNVMTFSWLAYWAYRAGYSIARGKRNGIFFAIIVHFLLCGVPLLLDVLYGSPSYDGQPGFRLATADPVADFIYCIYVSFVAPFWWYVGRTGEYTSNFKDPQAFGALARYRFVFYFLLVSPLLALMCAPEPTIYATYATFVIAPAAISEEAGRYNALISYACLMSIASAGAILMSKPRLKLLTIIMLAPWLGLAAWLNGKRAVFALILAVLLYVLWDKGMIRRKTAIVVGLATVLCLAFVSNVYQNTIREGRIGTTAQDVYDNWRIDYGRDHTIKMTIFAELYPAEMRILEYRGQSILFYLTAFVPRRLLPSKPMSYPQYYTCAMLRMAPQDLGWGVTTSWLEEAIANFSWFGMIIGPLTIALICRLGDKARNPIAGLLSILTASLLLAVEPTVCAPFLVLWAFYCLRPRALVSRVPVSVSSQ